MNEYEVIYSIIVKTKADDNIHAHIKIVNYIRRIPGLVAWNNLSDRKPFIPENKIIVNGNTYVLEENQDDSRTTNKTDRKDS